jgi:hypothetical protein
MNTKSLFVESIKLELDPFHAKKIDQIDQFDYSNVLEKVDMDSGGLTEDYLAEGALALKQYYAVALLDPLNEHAVSKYVDPFWHTHILFTKEYCRFCKEIFGGYIHHQPLDPTNEKEIIRVKRLYDATLNVYDKIFSSYDSSWWPRISPSTGQTVLAKKIVCLHMLVEDPAIMKFALFPAIGTA